MTNLLNSHVIHQVAEADPHVVEDRIWKAGGNGQPQACMHESKWIDIAISPEHLTKEYCPEKAQDREKWAGKVSNGK